MPQTLKSIIRVLELDEQSVLNTAGLPANYLLDETRQVEAKELGAFDRAVEQVSRRDDIAYKLAMFRAHTPRPSSTLAFAQCGNLLAGFERLAELKGPGDGTVLTLAVLDDRFRIEIVPHSPEIILLQWVVLCEILYFVELGRTYTGRRIVPVRAGVLAPDCVRAEDIAYLGVIPEWSEFAFVEFALTDGNRPLLTAQGRKPSDETSLNIGEEPAERQRLVSEQVEAVLLEIVPTGKCSIVTVSKHLKMTGRKLQRLLKAESTSYRAVLDETRRKLAIRYLQTERRPAAEVAELLGYQNLNSFYRAFKGWTGMTTTDFRNLP